MATLKNGETIPLLGNGQSVKILNYIAEGGQGEVYKVAFNGGEYALKWYSKFLSILRIKYFRKLQSM